MRCVHSWAATKIQVGKVKVTVLKCNRCGDAKVQTYKVGTESATAAGLRREAVTEIKQLMQHGASNAER